MNFKPRLGIVKEMDSRLSKDDKMCIKSEFFQQIKKQHESKYWLKQSNFYLFSLIILNLRISLKENLNIINTNFSFICYIFYHLITIFYY